MWGAISVIALGLLTIVVYSFTNDSNKREESKEEIKQEVKEEAKLPVETTPVKDKQHYSDYIDKDLMPNHLLGNSLDPYSFEFRFNKYFKDLNIDRSIDFGQVRVGSVRTNTSIGENIFVHASMHQDNMMLTGLSLTGFELETKEDFKEFKEVTLAFLASSAGKDRAYDFYKQLKFDDIVKNGGNSEFIVGDIKYVLANNIDDGGILIQLFITNIKNP